MGDKMKTRHPAVAGRFYPDDKKTLETVVKGFLKPSQKIPNAFAIISPHAGYIYSGKTAGAVFASVDVPDVVFVMCPNHTGLGLPVSLHPAETWVTPLGEIKSELDILQKIKNSVKEADFDVNAQLREHSLEVQLPFIQTCNPKAKIVPITLGGSPFNVLQKLGAVIADIMIDEEARTGKRPLIVASSDMTHFESVASAKQKDMLAIDKIKRLDTKGFIETIETNDISLCGIFPISVTLEAANSYSRSKGVKMSVDLVDYTNSGDVTGDTNEVVAYAGMVFHN